MTQTFESLEVSQPIQGKAFSPTKETIRDFCEASLDHNPLHLDDKYVADNFASKSEFDGIVMHGMSQFSMYTQMVTDWAYSCGGRHRRLETRWLKPVKPGDTVTPSGVIVAKDSTQHSRWVTIAVQMTNQRGEVVSKGEAQVEFPHGVKALR